VRLLRLRNIDAFSLETLGKLVNGRDSARVICHTATVTDAHDEHKYRERAGKTMNRWLNGLGEQYAVTTGRSKSSATKKTKHQQKKETEEAGKKGVMPLFHKAPSHLLFRGQHRRLAHVNYIQFYWFL